MGPRGKFIQDSSKDKQYEKRKWYTHFCWWVWVKVLQTAWDLMETTTKTHHLQIFSDYEIKKQRHQWPASLTW